ncbi:MAG: hypothetical protein ACRDKB_06680 [Actinomycetota bacterium]
MRRIRTRRRRGVISALAASLVAGVLFAAPAPSAAHGCGDSETYAVRNFHIEMKPVKKTYHVGDTAKVKFTVTRPAHEDPAGAGQEYDPPMSFPAEDVQLGVGLFVGETFFTGWALTDAEGKAMVSIKILRYADTGPAHARAYATKMIHQNVCVTVLEDGFTAQDNIFTVTR